VGGEDSDDERGVFFLAFVWAIAIRKARENEAASNSILSSYTEYISLYSSLPIMSPRLSNTAYIAGPRLSGDFIVESCPN
jgi:hypothetical protein